MAGVGKFEWLQEYSQLEHDIKFLKWNLRKTQHEADRWSIGDLAKLATEHDSKSSHLEADIQCMKKELAWRQNTLTELLALINSFDGIEEQILRKKYIEGETLEDIAADDDTHYALSYIRKKHAELHRRLKWLDQWDEDKYGDQVLGHEQLR